MRAKSYWSHPDKSEKLECLIEIFYPKSSNKSNSDVFAVHFCDLGFILKRKNIHPWITNKTNYQVSHFYLKNSLTSGQEKIYFRLEVPFPGFGVNWLFLASADQCNPFQGSKTVNKCKTTSVI